MPGEVGGTKMFRGVWRASEGPGLPWKVARNSIARGRGGMERGTLRGRGQAWAGCAGEVSKRAVGPMVGQNAWRRIKDAG